MTKKHPDPLDDEDWDGNDDQIDALKERVGEQEARIEQLLLAIDMCMHHFVHLSEQPWVHGFERDDCLASAAMCQRMKK